MISLRGMMVSNSVLWSLMSSVPELRNRPPSCREVNLDPGSLSSHTSQAARLWKVIELRMHCETWDEPRRPWERVLSPMMQRCEKARVISTVKRFEVWSGIGEHFYTEKGSVIDLLGTKSSSLGSTKHM